MILQGANDLICKRWEGKTTLKGESGEHQCSIKHFEMAFVSPLALVWI